MTTTKLRLTTVPDRSQSYVHAPQRALVLIHIRCVAQATALVAGKDPGHETRLRTSSMLDRDAPPMPWIRLCVRARPSANDALDTETCELCRELPPLLEPEPELVFRDLERERKALQIRASEVALPLREPIEVRMPWDSAGRKVEKGDQQSVRAFAPRVDHQARAVLSKMGGRPRGQTLV